jgi:NAD(P)-dependent dehydrogenase (short-subunit alcohol dehydrogenase family)
MIDFAGQVAIVTGAGRGLGRRNALEIARRGRSVVVYDVGSTIHREGSDPSVADAVVEEIVGAGGSAVASHASVASAEGGEAIVRTAVERFGRLDAVISNAGIFQTAEFDKLSCDDWQRMLRVHLDGSFHLGQPAFRAMKERGYGRFVFIASSAGLFGQPQSAHYAAAKAGIVGLANVVAIEGAAHGILANSVLPFGASRMLTETVGGEEVASESAFLRALDPELVVPIVVFLASRACGVTHHNYSAGAGRYARVFIGLAEGWLAEPGSRPTADEIAAHFAEISAAERFSIPGSIFEEVAGLCARLGIA